MHVFSHPEQDHSLTLLPPIPDSQAERGQSALAQVLAGKPLPYVVHKLSDYAPYNSSPVAPYDEPRFMQVLINAVEREARLYRDKYLDQFGFYTGILNEEQTGPRRHWWSKSAVESVENFVEWQGPAKKLIRKRQTINLFAARFVDLTRTAWPHFRGVDPLDRVDPSYCFDYPAFERAETQARRADRYAWEVAKRKAQPTVYEVKETSPIESAMGRLEDKWLRGEHKGVAWEMEPAHVKRVMTMPYKKALRYARAHRRWITERSMSTNGDFRSFKEIFEESRMFPK
jgi:hypothetical protein